MKKVIILALCVGLAACAAPPETAVVSDDPSGFWFGLWNGLTLFFSLIGSLFSDTIAVYDVDNKGGLYDFGFWLGASALGAGAGSRA